jgi:hypothetical protein
MIRAEEAIQLANSYKDNYRKQERIALENEVSAEVEKAARQGEYCCIITADPDDVGYIQEKLKENGFKCEVVPMATQFGKGNDVNIKVWWSHDYYPGIIIAEQVE